MKLSELDKKLLWHPFQSNIPNIPIVITKAEGVYLYDENNKKYLDLISSWWVNLHGHSNQYIAKAIYNQALTLEHVIFAGFTHEPAIKLCESLNNLLPDRLSRFFFSDNGSTAVEAALKISYQYWRNQGEDGRTTFLSFDGGYHGDTIGAMSVGKSSGFHDHFQQLLFQTITIPYPNSWWNDEHIIEKEEKSLKSLQKILDKEHKKIAAFIAEPLIQGASGMRVCSIGYLQKVVNLVRNYGILVIFDEVMTGFGRTGSMFAFQQLDLVPDFLCLSKGITGGFLPLALTITSNHIYEAFLGENRKSFAHGHSYTANPLGCAAAIASLDLLLDQKTQDSILAINETHKFELKKLVSNCSKIRKPRVIGTIAAFELNCADNNKGMSAFKEICLSKGLLIRPLGDVIYLLPPYSLTVEDLKEVYKIICESLPR